MPQTAHVVGDGVHLADHGVPDVGLWDEALVIFF